MSNNFGSSVSRIAAVGVLSIAGCQDVQPLIEPNSMLYDSHVLQLESTNWQLQEEHKAARERLQRILGEQFDMNASFCREGGRFLAIDARIMTSPSRRIPDEYRIRTAAAVTQSAEHCRLALQRVDQVYPLCSAEVFAQKTQLQGILRKMETLVVKKQAEPEVPPSATLECRETFEE